MKMLTTGKILVPVDFSEQSLAAVDVALEAAEDSSNVHVVHILPERQSGHPDAIWVAIDHAKLREHAIHELRNHLSDRKYEAVSLHIDFGDPGVRIAELAENLAANLIVLPSHGRTGIKRLLIGSVAERVVRCAHCPVLVLRE
ncbi:MAG: universal stress protein UspA [Planctomycetaceae bacterium]|nr:universal stress protein UspA [Planctomycetaceae bacterium]